MQPRNETIAEQLAALFRRGVVLPASDAGERSMRSWFLDEPTRVEWLPVVGGDESFGRLWRSGLFQAINQACNSTIGDYEEAMLEPSQLSAARAAVIGLKRIGSDEQVFRDELVALLSRACDQHRPLFFVF